MSSITLSQERQFGLLISAVLILLAYSAREEFERSAVVVLFSTAVLWVTWRHPSQLIPALRLWLKLGQRLQKIMQPVVLFILYFLVITPTGILRRWLRSKIQNPSHWTKRKSAMPTVSDLKRPY